MFIIFGNSNNFVEMKHTASYKKGDEIEENFEYLHTMRDLKLCKSVAAVSGRTKKKHKLCW